MGGRGRGRGARVGEGRGEVEGECGPGGYGFGWAGSRNWRGRGGGGVIVDIFYLRNDFRHVGVIENHNDCYIFSNDVPTQNHCYIPTPYIRRSHQWYHI